MCEIVTYTGRIVSPFRIKKDDISVEDVAHALSLLCRFNGHSSFFYSVAQHSLNVEDVLRRMGFGGKVRLMGLFHDASEVYVSDLPSPIKPFLEGYRDNEREIQDRVWDFLGLEVSKEELEQVIRVDKLVFLREAEVFSMDISIGDDVDILDKRDLEVVVKEEDWRVVKNNFLERYKELKNKILIC